MILGNRIKVVLICIFATVVVYFVLVLTKNYELSPDIQTSATPRLPSGQISSDTRDAGTFMTAFKEFGRVVTPTSDGGMIATETPAGTSGMENIGTYITAAKEIGNITVPVRGGNIAVTASPADGKVIGTTVAVSTEAFWRPKPGISWQIILGETLSEKSTLSAEVYDIDLFDNEKGVVDALHTKGKKAICYFSAGSWEDWRDDASAFPADVLGNDYTGWEGEKWIDIRKIDKLAPIIRKRLDLCKEKGFDGVDFDNLDSFQNETGFPLTAEDQIVFNKWIAVEAHTRGLAAGLKNDTDQASQLVNYFDWVITEGCASEGWCDLTRVFINHEKPVFQIEYTDTDVDFQKACIDAKQEERSPVLKRRNLDVWVQYCK